MSEVELPPMTSGWGDIDALRHRERGRTPLPPVEKASKNKMWVDITPAKVSALLTSCFGVGVVAFVYTFPVRGEKRERERKRERGGEGERKKERERERG